MALTFRAFALASALAGTTLFAVPAAAAPLNASAPSGIALGSASAAFDYSRFDSARDTADWRGCRWNCGWGGGWGRHRGWRRNRIGAGDVILGAAIIGGIAAIASSNNRRQRERDVVIVERDVRQPDVRYDDRRFDDRRTNTPRGTGASGLDNAVSQCLDRIERDVRVEAVDNVERTGAGWRVSGVLFNGSPFQCRIGNGGQIDGIDYGDGFRDVGFSDPPADAAPRGEGQWDDRRYATARASVGGTVRPDMAVQEASMISATTPVRTAAASTAMPAYPGGPIPGEVIPETVDIER